MLWISSRGLQCLAGLPLHRGIEHFPGRSRARGVMLATIMVLLVLAATGCSVVVRKAGKTLASGSSVYATDDDPDFVWEAAPFGLKTIEVLLVQAPNNKDLLLAAASGFTQYAYGHLQQEADFSEANDLAAATNLRARARKMYLRAREYGLRGLEVDFPDFRTQLHKDPQAAVKRLREKHVPLTYWTASAWGAAIALSKDDAELSAGQNLTEMLMKRALALDETWQRGSIHDFFIPYEGGAPPWAGRWRARAFRTREATGTRHTHCAARELR